MFVTAMLIIKLTAIAVMLFLGLSTMITLIGYKD